MPSYAELQVTSNFSFLRGASHPEELVTAAAKLGLTAIAITDRNTLAGVVRAHTAAKAAGIKLVVGTRLDLEDCPSLLCFPSDRAAYGRLSRLLTVGRRRAPKGKCRLNLADVLAHDKGQIMVVIPPAEPDQAFAETLPTLKNNFNKNLYLSVSAIYRGDDARRLAILADLAGAYAVPLVVTNDVHVHKASRRALQDVLICIREHCTIYDAGYRLFANAERHLKPPAEMMRLFSDYPEAISHTVEIAEKCAFNLDELRYEYPVDPISDGCTPQEELTRLTWAGAAKRYPQGVPNKVRIQVGHELVLIDALGFAPYFITVYDIVRFAHDQGIFCQGRGSAANSAVCYCLGITAVDPTRMDFLFERFVSAERNEPPDIDVDFEHERREEVIQYIYEKYGRDRAGMTATVISYRTKSALREVGKVMGLSDDSIVALQRVFWRRSWSEVTKAHISSAGLDPNDRTIRMVIDLAGDLRGFPRHLSQHTGGMVITQSSLSEVVPIENAAMADRTVIEWDKDDLNALGILKIDVLGLGMLTVIRKAFALIKKHHGHQFDLATVPAEDAEVYEMLCRADSIGVFQVESRAQMSMLPRLKPRNFYDLVIEVAIVRPGPIQGDMVHPYLRRRQGLETVKYPSDELQRVLDKTLGIPLFQEQAMRIAIVAAGFTPSEADGLRRAMATFRRSGTIHGFKDKFISGALGRGYERDFAERCFKQIEGFADYGFPESHAASFALIVYVSAWLKCHYPAAFACALLNSQPMGFYAPAQIINDARRHSVQVRPVDVNFSDVDCTLEPVTPPHSRIEKRHLQDDIALRLGFRQVKGLATRDVRALIAARQNGYRDLTHLWHRAGMRCSALKALANADAFRSLSLDRQQALWAVGRLNNSPLPLFDDAESAEIACEPRANLPQIPLSEQVAEDYRALRLSLKAHPISLLRRRLGKDGYLPSKRLTDLKSGEHVKVAGLVITRQRPGSANGVIFITLEDETGHANLIVWPTIFERFRQTVLRPTMIGIKGPVQREGTVIHVVVKRLWDLDPLLGSLKPTMSPNRAADEAKFDVQSRDFH